jgi:hypothetical protein
MLVMVVVSRNDAVVSLLWLPVVSLIREKEETENQNGFPANRNVVQTYFKTYLFGWQRERE